MEAEHVPAVKDSLWHVTAILNRCSVLQTDKVKRLHFLFHCLQDLLSDQNIAHIHNHMESLSLRILLSTYRFALRITYLLTDISVKIDKMTMSKHIHPDHFSNKASVETYSPILIPKNVAVAVG